MALDEPETLEQLGKRLGVSRERVRQLEHRAKQKLREALSA
jgi:RNA polymerase sigma-32 factor